MSSPSAPPFNPTVAGRTAQLAAPREDTGTLISRGEWWWLLTFVALLLAMTQVPPTMAHLVGVPDRIHVGTYWYAFDFSQYLAAMNEGARSASWLIHDHLTSEPHTPALMYPLYVAIGKLAALLGLPVLAVHAVVELAMRVLLPLSVYWLAALCLPRVDQRRFALVLATLGSGLAIWAWVVLSALGVGMGSSGDPSPANTYVEVVTFGVLFAAPHVGLGLAGTLAGAALFIRACAGSRGAIVLLALDAIFLALIHPFNLPVLIGACGLFAVAQSVWQRTPAWRAFVAAGVAGAVSAPLILQNFLTFTRDPFWGQTYGAQNIMPSPRPWELPIDYGIVLLMGLVGVFAARRAGRPAIRFLLIWLAVGAIFMYVPVPYQRRFAFGLQPVLAIFAALGWPLLRAWAVTPGQRLFQDPVRQAGFTRRITQYPLFILGFTGSLLTFLAVSMSAATNFPVPIYILDQDTYAVGQWIAERSGEEDVVAGSENTGNILAGLVPGRVVIGYDVATLNAKEKKQAIKAMYKGDLSEEETRGFLAANRATYLVVGPEERKIGPSDPGARLGYPVATRIGETTAYRVVH